MGGWIDRFQIHVREKCKSRVYLHCIITMKGMSKVVHKKEGILIKKSRPLESSVFQMRLSCRPHPYMTLAVGGMLIHTTENLASNHILHTSGLEMLGPI